MPIKNFELVGNWTENAPKYAWTSQDIGILKSDKAIAKIKRAFEKTDHVFNFYFVRHPKGKDMAEHGKFDNNDYPLFKLDMDYTPDDDAINVIFTNNVADDRVPFTAWTIAHRMGHAFRRCYYFQQAYKEFDSGIIPLLNQYNINLNYWGTSNRETCKFFNHIGTMRSARHNRITRAGEFAHELLAQSLLCNRIKFNDLPRSLLVKKHFAWGKPNHQYKTATAVDMEEINHDLRCVAKATNYNLDSAFTTIIGDSFIM